MKTTSSKQKGQRIFKSYKRPYWIEPLERGWNFNTNSGEWEFKSSKRGLSTAYYNMSAFGFNDCHSLKAVKRLIHKWNVPKGTVFIASLPWVGYEFKITK